MMDTQRHPLLNAFSALLSYPATGYADSAQTLGTMLEVDHPDALDEWRIFHTDVATHDLHELEEQFTRTFEINAQCALEVGWHLFGEEYLRGQFLVRLRKLLRKHNLPESTELPDHITHVLAVLAAMSHDDAAGLAAACVLPSLDKMLQAFAGKQNAYEHLLRCLRLVLCREFDLPEECTLDDEAAVLTGHADPLWSYPVQGQPVGGSVQFVPLELHYGNPLPSEIAIRAGEDAS